MRARGHGEPLMVLTDTMPDCALGGFGHDVSGWEPKIDG